MKIAFASWIMNVQNEKIFDPFIADYHFKGTYSAMSFDDEDCVEKTTATVTFKAYPYKIANVETTVKTEIAYSESGDMERTVEIINSSSHRLVPTVVVEGAVSIRIGGASVQITSGTYEDDFFMLPVGKSEWVVTNQGTETATVTVSFFEEVF